MKKILFTIWTIVCCLTVEAQEYEASFYGNGISIPTDGTATVTLGMKNNFEMTAWAFWIDLPEGVMIDQEMNEDDEMAPVVALSARKKSDHIMFFQKTISGGTQIACLSGSLKTFRGNDGDMVYVRLKADKDMPAGDYNIKISNISFSDVNGKSCIQDAFNIPLTVVETDGVADVNADSVKDGAVYSVNGVKITNVDRAGIYISKNKKYANRK